jgi:hypothetical protein
VWKWIGYSRIDPCKIVLIKNFVENKDYKIEKAAPEISGAGFDLDQNDEKIKKKKKNLGGAGQNKENILLTINCFKKLCLKSRTDQADKIHDYYIQMEEIINNI